MLYGTGMRVSELIHLQTQDMNRSTRSLKVLGKRNKERIIPVSDELTQALDIYLRYRENFISALESKQGGDYLFLTEKGNKTYPKLIYFIVKKYLEQVTTIDKKSPHVLRHTFATHLLSHGADLNAIKELLGHANLAATQVYTHNSIDQLKSVYKRAHPKGK
jgi:integrase/recombinase XerC